jgi:hypothetical protein
MTASILQCLLYPRKQTLIASNWMLAKGQQETSAIDLVDYLLSWFDAKVSDGGSMQNPILHQHALYSVLKDAALTDASGMIGYLRFQG